MAIGLFFVFGLWVIDACVSQRSTVAPKWKRVQGRLDDPCMVHGRHLARAVNRSGETVDSWEACIEFHDGATIRLGRESEGQSERIRSYLEEIRRVAGFRDISSVRAARIQDGKRAPLIAPALQRSRPSTLAAFPPAIWANVASSIPCTPAICPIGLYSAMSNG